MGPISPNVESQIRSRLGFKVRSFPATDPVALSEELDTWAAAVHVDHLDEVVAVQLNQLATGVPAIAWNAHICRGLVFVQSDTIPENAKRILARRYRGEPFVYLMGNASIISEAAAKLARYAHVQRVPGANAEKISVNFGGYQDSGYNQGYRKRDVGWGLAEAGHNFTFANPNDWRQSITGSLLSHPGQYDPMLLISRDATGEAVERYLRLVRSRRTLPRNQLINHGWILGDVNQIAWETQVDIDDLLESEGKEALVGQ